MIYNRWVGYNQGGSETYIKELAVQLSQCGHKVDILTTGDSALRDIKKHFRKIINVTSSQEYFSYSYWKILKTLNYVIESLRVFRKLIYKDKEVYDVVIVRFSLEALVMRFIRFIYGIPYVYILAGDTDFELIEGKRADNASNLTVFMAKQSLIYGYFPEILFKGMDFRRFNEKVNGLEIRKKYIKNKKQFLVLTVCRLDPRKDVETIIRTADLLERKHPGIFKFVIVGGGVEENKLKNIIARRKLERTVHMVGQISNTSDLLPKYYASADVFALPSLYEGFGWVFSEAMSTGLPVIGADNSVIPEVIGDVGALFPSGNEKALAAVIYDLYKNPSLRKTMSKKSLAKSSLWGWETQIIKHEKFIRDGIKRFSARKGFFRRFINFAIPLCLDAPIIIYVFLRTMRGETGRWGSIFKKKV